MSDIHELNAKRARAKLVWEAMGYMNTPTNVSERLKADAAYELARRAYQAADLEFVKAVRSMSVDELAALATPTLSPSSPTLPQSSEQAT